MCYVGLQAFDNNRTWMINNYLESAANIGAKTILSCFKIESKKFLRTKPLYMYRSAGAYAVEWTMMGVKETGVDVSIAPSIDQNVHKNKTKPKKKK